MASLWQRLFDLGRAHLNDLWTSREPAAPRQTVWETEYEPYEQTQSETDSHTATEEGAGSTTGQRLPYSEELARCYRLLDLPFGTPLKRVTRQWKTYLKRCHPDRHAKDPAKQADATLLTQQLNDAYRKIKQAWQRQQR